MSSAFGADPAPTEHSAPEDAGHPVPERTGERGQWAGGDADGKHLRWETAVGKHVRMEASQATGVGASGAARARGRHPVPTGAPQRPVGTCARTHRDRYSAAEWGGTCTWGSPSGFFTGRRNAFTRGPLAGEPPRPQLALPDAELRAPGGGGLRLLGDRARLFSVSEVGLATALFSAMGIVAFASLLGLNSTVVRHLPRSSERNVLITAAMTLVSGCGVFLAVCYLALIPVVSPKLDFVSTVPRWRSVWSCWAECSARSTC